jgi:hypothetical protein
MVRGSDPLHDPCVAAIVLVGHPAHRLVHEPNTGPCSAGGLVPQTAATFADGLALVRRELWAQAKIRLSASEPGMVKALRTFIEQLTETLCYAA